MNNSKQCDHERSVYINVVEEDFHNVVRYRLEVDSNVSQRDLDLLMNVEYIYYQILYNAGFSYFY